MITNLEIERLPEIGDNLIRGIDCNFTVEINGVKHEGAFDIEIEFEAEKTYYRDTPAEVAIFTTQEHIDITFIMLFEDEDAQEIELNNKTREELENKILTEIKKSL